MSVLPRAVADHFHHRRRPTHELDEHIRGVELASEELAARQRVDHGAVPLGSAFLSHLAEHVLDAVPGAHHEHVHSVCAALAHKQHVRSDRRPLVSHLVAASALSVPRVARHQNTARCCHQLREVRTRSAAPQK